MKKKLICLCICAVVFRGLLSGCGQNADPAQQPQNSAAQNDEAHTSDSVEELSGDQTIRYSNEDTLNDGSKLAVSFVTDDGLYIYMTVDRPEINFAGLRREGRDFGTDTVSLSNYDTSSIFFHGRTTDKNGRYTTLNTMKVDLERPNRLTEYLYEDGNWAIEKPFEGKSIHSGIYRVDVSGHNAWWMSFPLKMDEYYRDELNGNPHTLTYDEAVTVLQRYQTLYHFYYSETGDWHDALDFEGNPADLSSYTFLEDLLLQSFNTDGFCVKDAAWVSGFTISTDISFRVPCADMDKPAQISLEYQSSTNDLELYPDSFTVNGFTVYYEVERARTCAVSILSDDGSLALEGSVTLPVGYPGTATGEDFKNLLLASMF